MAQHFASTRSTDEKLDADVLDIASDTIYVEYPSGSTAIEPRNRLNELLFLSDSVPRDGMVTFWGYADANPSDVLNDTIDESTSTRVSYTYDVYDKTTTVEINNNTVDTSLLDTSVLLEYVAEFRDDYVPPHADSTPNPERCMEARVETARKIVEHHRSETQECAEPNTVAAFVDAFDADIDVRDDGWYIDNRVCVKYSLESYLLSDMTVYNCTALGDEPVECDTRAECLQIRAESMAEKPLSYDGITTSLSNNIEFLTKVALLTEPVEFMNVDYFGDGDYAERQRQDSTVIDNIDGLGVSVDTADVTGFVDPTSGILHGHDFDKHQLTDIGVARPVIEELHFSQFDHAGPHEMLARREEFESEFDTLFTDDVIDPWGQIRSARDSATVPDRVHQQL